MTDILSLDSFNVNNFKPILDSEDVNLDDFNVFIGKNDAGKSSLLEALKIFLSKNKPSSSHFHKNQDVEISMTAEFFDIPEELDEALTEEYQNESNTLTITRLFEKRVGTTPSATTIVNGNELSAGAVYNEDDRLTMADSRDYIWRFMPRPVYVPAERDVTEETKLKNGTLLNDLLVPVLEEGGVGDNESLADTKSSLEASLIDTSQIIGAKLTESMQTHLPDLEEVEIAPGSVRLEKAISPEVKLKDQYLPESVGIGQRGSGVGSLFILSLMQAYVDMQVGEGYCLLFEEPGNSLHPGAERKMLDALRAISEGGGQILITTHSQVFIDRTDSGQLYLVKRTDGESQFRCIQQDAFEAVEEIGARNSDLLQSDFVFYVEGPSDVVIVEAICKNLCDDWEDQNITVQHLGGTGNIRHCEPEKLKMINRNCAFILDSDRDGPDANPNSVATRIKSDSDDIGIPCRILEKACIENYFTAVGVNQVFDVSAETDFIGDYDNAVECIKQVVAEEHRPDGDPEQVNYKKIKHGQSIVNAMHENGEQVGELEEFVSDCLSSN